MLKPKRTIENIEVKKIIMNSNSGIECVLNEFCIKLIGIE